MFFLETKDLRRWEFFTQDQIWRWTGCGKMSGELGPIGLMS